MIEVGKPVAEAEIAEQAEFPRITPKMIEDHIEYAVFTDGYDLCMDAAITVLDGRQQPTKFSSNGIGKSLESLTICLIVLKNGFTVLGKSAPVSPGNFSRDIGQRLAYQDAFNQLWPLFGFELKQRIYEVEGVE